MCLVLLTVKAGFAVTDAATNLKLIEYGMPKEEIALMSPLLILTGRASPPPHFTLPARPFLSISPPSFPPPPPPLPDPSDPSPHALPPPPPPGILVPVLLTRQTSGPRPLSVFLKAFAPRLLVGLLYLGLLPLAHRAYPHSTSLPPSFPPVLFRLLFLTTVGLREVAANSMFISQMAFFARVSDPAIGGTYMTLLNTVR
jgi:PAT family acetyl-CoA transporter-like MFS transporter 1